MNNLSFDDKVFLLYLEFVKGQPLGLPESKAKMLAEKAFLMVSYAQEKWDEMIADLADSDQLECNTIVS